jgi:FAD/FMN-containing dehydrogenase
MSAPARKSLYMWIAPELVSQVFLNIMDEAIELFKSKKIPVFRPGGTKKEEEEYERSVATPNLLYRFSRPDCVIQPEDASHVQAIIKEAKSKKLKITIKCAGHSYAGHSTAFQGISLDLRRMKNVKLDLKSKTVTMDSGCQWGEVYKTLINDRRNGNGFIINGGRCPPVGVSGFILGGGLGPFTRSFGMGSDTLMEATVVTAGGEMVTVNENHSRNSEKGMLFWALRGAGGGNFGVLVSMKLKVQQLQNRDGVVVAGRYQWFPDAEAMKLLIPTMNSFYTTDWPNKITIDSTWLCDLRQSTGDGIRFLTYFDGNKNEFDNLIDKYIKLPDLAKQLKRRSLPEESTRFLHETLVAQWSEETVRSFPTNKTYTIYSSFVFTNDKDTIEKLTAIIKKEMETFRRLYSGEKVEFLVTWIHSGGKAMENSPDTAFFWRKAVYQTYVTVEWEDKWMERDMRGFLGKVKKELRPYSLNKEAAFINFPDGILSKKAYERAYFGENRQELRRVKEIWDKDNFFGWDQGIQLPQGAVDDPNGDVDMPNDENFTDSIAREQWKVFESKDVVADLDYLTKGGF